MLTILNENQLRQIFTCKRSPYFLFSVYVNTTSVFTSLSFLHLSFHISAIFYLSLTLLFFFSSTQIYPFQSSCLFSLLEAFLSPLENCYLNALQGEKKKKTKKHFCLWAVDKFQLFSIFLLTQKHSPYSVCHVSHLFLTILCPWHYYKMETTLSGFAKNLSFHFSVIFIHSLFTRALIFAIGTALHYAFEGLFSFYVHIIQFSSSSSASPITLFRIFFWSPASVSWLEPGHLCFPGH